jgi:glycosyltransferase involved in cell wall biosynthesis
MAEKMRELLIDGSLGREFAERGLRRAEIYTWENSAKKHMDIFESVLKGS